MWILTAGLLILGASSASAQPPYPYPYPGGVYAPYAGAGGQLAGSAQVIDAYGGFQQQQQQAQITHQQALQEQLKTKKAEFDWKQYEAANTPTFGQMIQNEKLQLEYRILTNPTDYEITSGKALNVLAPVVTRLNNKGIQGPPVLIAPWVLPKIAVTAPGGSSAGMLKGGGVNLEFPIMLQGPLQQKIANEVPQAVAMVSAGKLDFKFYKQVLKDVEALKDESKTAFQKDEIDGGEYIVGLRFLESLENSIKLMIEPGAGKYFQNSYQLTGSTVEQLVMNMSQQGITFGPSLTGNEPAYVSLYNAMVSYITKAQSGGGGFQMQPGIPFSPGPGVAPPP